MKCPIPFCLYQLKEKETPQGRPFYDCRVHGFQGWIERLEEKLQDVTRYALMGLGLTVILVQVARWAR